MKRAFTMVELIFVIVVVGVLAAIAIPKLAATRDDAKIVTTAKKIAAAAREITASAVSRGDINLSNLTAASRLLSGMTASREASDDGNGTVRFRMGSVADCIVLRIVRGNGDVNLTLSYGNNGAGDPLCRGLQKAVDVARYPIPLRGSRVLR